MAQGPYVQDVDVSSFDQVVIEGSRERLVLVDFWAPWCGPCRALGPVLEKLATDYAGKFLLAKVNSDENQELSVQYGVRGIPAVKAFLDGRVVDEFTGALPESAVRQFLDKLIPSEGDKLRAQAAVLRQSGQAGEAESLLHAALQADPRNDRVRLDLARIYVETGREAEATAMIEQMQPTFRMEPEVEALQAALEFVRLAAQAPDEATLLKTIESTQGDNRAEAMLQLAAKRVLRNDYEGAMQQLLEMVREHRSYGDDAGRKTLLKVFTMLGNQGELVSRYRAQLARALY
ncbi:thioredoxin [Thermithiobacillus plumbiphilus]|uniref:Thioredoxin n=1 Tax=Thermithiobacillus plumbiphilus TaxID=1729899 RepID=A0ABU9D6B8_9PROT